MTENVAMPRRLAPLCLAYHAVGRVPLRQDPHRLFTAPEALRRHVARLRAYGYRFVTVGELARRVAAGAGAGLVALSFDDGFDDALPDVLGGLPATVFPVTGWLGGPHPDAPSWRIRSAESLRVLQRAGVEIGGHTVTHPDLTKLAPNEARRELRDSRRMLEEMLEAPVEVAAYPYGLADEATRAACAAAGYRAAVQITGQGSWDEPYALPRQNMLAGCTTAGLRLKRDGRYEDFVARPVPRRVGRALRRLRGVRPPA